VFFRNVSTVDRKWKVCVKLWDKRLGSIPSNVREFFFLLQRPRPTQPPMQWVLKVEVCNDPGFAREPSSGMEAQIIGIGPGSDDRIHTICRSLSGSSF
jgi:hypothetical protein